MVMANAIWQGTGEGRGLIINGGLAAAVGGRRRRPSSWRCAAVQAVFCALGLPRPGTLTSTQVRQVITKIRRCPTALLCSAGAAAFGVPPRFPVQPHMSADFVRLTQKRLNLGLLAGQCN